MNDVSINDIEQDLINETTKVLPRIIIRLLYTLSYDRKVSLNNWQTALRKQYFKRDPASNPIGPEPPRPDQHEPERHDDSLKHEEEPDADHKEVEEKQEEDQGSTQGDDAEYPSEKDSTSLHNATRASSVAASHHQGPDGGESLDWTKLPMLSKLDSIHSLIEWQFQNPTRLRQIMKDDDEVALWRIEPIGYDSKRNAYWFIGGNRLWIQREPPKPPRKTAAKRKRAPQPAKEESISKPAAKRARTKASTASTKAKEEPPTPSGRSARAAKAQANLKLNAQAKELAELNRQAALSARPRRGAAPNNKSPPKPLGTRVSARLRGTQEDEWQEIPDEWLEEPMPKDKGRRKAKPVKTGLEDDDTSISDLTELSDEEEDSDTQAKETVEEVEPPKAEVEEPKAPEPPSDFVEWEMICATLYEWEHVTEQFANATHYTEKALYKLLSQQIVPEVVHELKEIEKKRQIEEALSHRKRSSRLAIRESEKEEARLAAQRKTEEDEKLSRARRLEARQQKEEAERLKKEQAREQRRKDREAREASRHASVSTQEPATQTAAPTPEPNDKEHQQQTDPKPPAKRPRQKAKRDDWELDCEICHQRGINLDDGTPLMSCGKCSKWQHIRCHDRADQLAGRPRRNWDVVDFICLKCRGIPQSSNQPRHNGYATTYAQPTVPVHIPPIQSPHHQNYHHPHASSSLQSVVHNGYSQHSRYGDAHQMYSQPHQPIHMQSAPHYGQPPRQTISFSHYQPSNQAFSPNTHRGYPDTMRPYQGTGYVESAISASKVPIANQWNVSTPTQSSGYVQPSPHSVPPSQHLENGHQPHNHPPVATPPITQFRHHPSSYSSQQLGR
ncbi:hypothetical protein BJ165DRAFT_1023939 [Panaeolus papilionaceus]|nr:hypothetical protein BJ165DRAFT_1023939 [Panaeolus papilionaceus]